MNFRQSLLSILFIAATTFTGIGANPMDDPMTQTLMKTYSQLLDEDPHDADVLFRRANIYYKCGDYIRALDDINMGFKYAENSEFDTQSALDLRANIYMMLHKDEQALADLNAVLANDPNNYIATYQRATALYNLGRYAEAKSDFRQLQLMNPRSQEALFGLARVAVKENNLGIAEEMCERAVALTPTNSNVYMRRAAVRTMMGNDQGAVQDYLVAISTDQESTPKALGELVVLSRTNYPVVISGISGAIRQAPNNGIFYFIRAMIAQGHSNYLAAIADYDKIINEHLDSYAGINASLAECYYALGKYDIAEVNIDYAISATNDNAFYYILKSRIELALGNEAAALSCAEKALEKTPESNEALIAKGLASLANGDAADASVCFSEAAMNAPEDAYLALLRAWVLADYRKQPKNAERCYQLVLDMDTPIDEISSYRGFALLFLDKKDEGDTWMQRVLATANDYDGEVSYYAACYYAQSGDFNNAFKYMEKSLEKGYANYHNWTKNNDARVNVAPLRSDPRFESLLKQYSVLFNN